MSVHSTRPDQRPHVLIDDLVIPWDQFTSARTSESMKTIMERALGSGKQHVLVYDDLGRQVGYVSLDGFLASAS